MKQYKISLFALAAALLTTACNDMDEQYLEGGSITPEQLLAANVAVPSRVDASFVGMYGYMWAGGSGRVITTQNRADDFGMIMSHISLSLEGADAFGSDNGYNWFSTASEYSDRDPNYANPFIRYTTPYRQAGVANGLIKTLGDMLASAPGDTVTRNKLGQAYAIRAFDYLSLAPYFAGNYAGHKNDLRTGIAADPGAVLVRLFTDVDGTGGNRGVDRFDRGLFRVGKSQVIAVDPCVLSFKFNGGRTA